MSGFGFGPRWLFILLAVVVLSLALGVGIYCITSLANVIIDAADFLSSRYFDWRSKKK